MFLNIALHSEMEDEKGGAEVALGPEIGYNEISLISHMRDNVRFFFKNTV